MKTPDRKAVSSRRDAILASALGVTAGLITLNREAGASTPEAQENSNPAAKARAEDIMSVESIIRALYDSISGPPGTRDWDRMRGLFLPGARLIPSGRRPDGSITARVLSVDDFIKAIEPRVKDEGFYESEIHRRVERFGAIAHVFSTYESRHAKDEKPFVRGINSFQLFFDGKRWWVVTIFWDSERPDQAIPDEYLPGK
jgi:hypothetical protein